MGVWGDGIFEGDSACDFLGDTISRLADVVDEGLKLATSKRSAPSFKRAELAKGHIFAVHSPVAPTLAILNVIVARIPPARFCLEKRRVREWKRAFFKWYEEEFIPMNGPAESVAVKTGRFATPSPKAAWPISGLDNR